MCIFLGPSKNPWCTPLGGIDNIYSFPYDASGTQPADGFLQISAVQLEGQITSPEVNKFIRVK